MKFEAHPLVVAVALGLLSPLALAEDESTDECAWADADASSVLSDLLGESVEEALTLYEPGPVPDAEAFRQVELAWLQVK